MSKEKPTVSVIIPTYNRAKLLPRAIKSVLNQTFKDFEVIIVDDGSTDNTEEVINEFQKHDKRIKYIRHEKNKGAAAARNTGIKIAQGEYIAFQDSDDEWLPEKLEKQMKIFESAPAEIGVVYTGLWRMGNSRKVYIPSIKRVQKEGNIHIELLNRNFIALPTVIIRKECFKKAGMFDECFPRFQDWELFIRISRVYKFKYIDEPLVNSYFTPISISTDRDAFVKAFNLILEKYHEDFTKDRKILSKHQYLIGNFLCQNGDLHQGRDYLFRAVRLYPLNIKFLLATFISFLGQGIYNKVLKIYLKIKGV